MVVLLMSLVFIVGFLFCCIAALTPCYVALMPCSCTLLDYFRTLLLRALLFCALLFCTLLLFTLLSHLIALLSRLTTFYCRILLLALVALPSCILMPYCPPFSGTSSPPPAPIVVLLPCCSTLLIGTQSSLS
jgi:hypothetical protein